MKYIRIIEGGIVDGGASIPFSDYILNEWGASNGDIMITDGDGNYIGFSSPNRTTVSKWEFMSLFTPQENRAIKNKAKTDDNVDQLWDILTAAITIDLKLPLVVNGMAYLVSVGVLTQERHDELMLGVPADV